MTMHILRGVKVTVPLASVPEPPHVEPGKLRAVCHHPSHCTLAGIRYGVVPLDSDTQPELAALRRCRNSNKDGG